MQTGTHQNKDEKKNGPWISGAGQGTYSSSNSSGQK